MNFVHLNTRSHASFQRSSVKPKDLVKKTKELGQPAVAVIDYGNAFNAIPFYRAAKSEGIKPILGAEVFLTIDNDQARLQKERKVWHLVLLAENNVGWQNICRILSLSNNETNFYFRNRVDFKMLEQHSEGIIVLGGSSFDGLIPFHLYDKMDDEGQVREAKAIFKANGLLRRLIDIFDTNHVFLEVQDHGYSVQGDINDRLRSLAAKNGVRCVASNNVHYVSQSNAEAHRTLRSMGYNPHNPMTLTDFDREEFYLKSRDEMEHTSLLGEELDLSLEIAERCNVEIDLKKRRLPSYRFLPEGVSAEERLHELARAGLRKRTIGDSTYCHRLERELTDIHDMGFDDYFLIVHDVCDWVHSQDIQIGRGRGSAGGSLVSFCLGITDIDPLQYDLLWERFLNKGRGGLPDIDTDFPRSRRKEVLGYIQDRFGTESVAQIVTFNGMQARAILKEVFKVYGAPHEEANTITKLIPAKDEDHLPITLEKAIEQVPALKEYAEKYKAWFTIAQELEGCYKSISTHAAAVVISDVPFEQSNYPLCRAADGKSLIFGYDMETVDSLSLLKLDILGLTTLDDISVATELVAKRHGREITRENMPLDDTKTFELIGTGKTAGIFQIERQLGRTWARKLKPISIDELSDLVSIIRPGPLDSGMADEYAKVKSGSKKPTYIHPSLEAILDKTYSGCLYQEQVMAICSLIAGFSLYDADSVRKAMGKKKHEEMEKWKEKFIDGCKSHSDIDAETAGRMWEFIEKFAGYGFNKSHGIGYGLLSYETAYFKANYPLEFFCAKLRNAKYSQDPSEEIRFLVNDAKLFDIEIIPPRVSAGNADFDVISETEIAFGLGSLKGVGEKALKPLSKVNQRDLTADEFLWRAIAAKVNKTVMEAVIRSGAVDDLGMDRVRFLARYRLIMSLTDKERHLIRGLTEASGVSDWTRPVKGVSDESKLEIIKEKYGDVMKEGGLKLPNVRRRQTIREILAEYESEDKFDSKPQNIAWESHYLGISLSGNPADIYKAPDSCRDIAQFPSEGRRVEIAVTVSSVREIVTRKPPPRAMAFVTAGDDTYQLDNLVVFPQTFEKCGKFLEEGAVLKIRGHLDARGSVLVDKMERLR